MALEVHSGLSDVYFYASHGVILADYVRLRPGWLIDNVLARVAALFNGGGAYFPPLI